MGRSYMIEIVSNNKHYKSVSILSDVVWPIIQALAARIQHFLIAAVNDHLAEQRFA
jgi:hypothetical protein